MKHYDFDGTNLPKTNPNENLETISNHFFKPLFAVEKFEIRSETVRDKGIDFHIELKMEPQNCVPVYTNFRFAVQLKATGSIKANVDGSFSLKISSSNINYLLNNGMPAFYVFYHKPTHTFYFENVNVFLGQIQKKDVDWQQKEKHTLRFSKLLTSESMSSIYDEVYNSGLLLRRLNRHLKLKDGEEKSPGILIDADYEVYSVTENIDFLDRFGADLITREQFSFIINIEQRTHPRTEATPQFNLVCGIAYFQTGNLYKAMELLKLAKQKSESFNVQVQAMLSYTLLYAKFLLGVMNRQDFDAEMLKITENQDSGTFFEIEKAYDELSGSKEGAANDIEIFYTTIGNIIKKDEKNIHMRITAYAKILHAESIMLFHDLEVNFSYFIWYSKSPLNSRTYLEFLRLEATYLKRLDALTEYALKKRYYLGVSNLLSSKIEWNYRKIYHKHLFNSWRERGFNLGAPLESGDLDDLINSCKKLDKIVETYEMLEHRENMVSCLNRKYQILRFIGHDEEAAVTKNKIVEIIESNDFVGLKSRHDELINGHTGHEQFITQYTSRINKIQELASEVIDIRNYLADNSIETMVRNPTWSIKHFFEFVLPE